MKNKSKVATAIVAGVAAVALLLGGTFAWQSISQTALNEASDVINPGGRLHDDFDGSNKDVYVENFADEPIFARIQLSEYFAIIANYGKGEAETRNELVGTLSADGTYTYETHLFDTADGAHDYWNWAIGGSTVYMPTFNKNKDSLEADINGTYVDAVGGISNRDGNQYTDYTEYEVDATDTADAIYDADANNIEDDGVTYVNETHTAKETLGATLISMDEWMTTYNSEPGEYWVYDTDGWVYWAQAIAPDTATGLLLDSIELSQVMDDTWYYAINVEAQFVTADDVGKSDSTGFYEDAAKAPSANAEALLKAIGVQIDGEAEPEPEVVYAITAAPVSDEGFYGGYFADNSTYNLTMTKDGEALENVTWSMELVEGGTADSNNTLDGTSIDPATGVVTVAADETTYNTYYTTYHVVEVTATAEDGSTASQYFVICNYGVSATPRVVNVDGTDITGDIVVGETYKLALNPYECGTNQSVAEYVDVTLNSENTTFTVYDENDEEVATDAVTLNDDGTFVASESGTYRYTFSAGYFSGSNTFTVA